MCAEGWFSVTELPICAHLRRGVDSGAAADRRPRPSGLDVGHHVLDARVVLEAVRRQVLAVSAVLEPAVWHLGDEWDVRVDPDTAEVEVLRHPHRPAVVARPDTGCESVLDAVGPLQR